jgi:hypothetical protein
MRAAAHVSLAPAVGVAGKCYYGRFGTSGVCGGDIILSSRRRSPIQTAQNNATFASSYIASRLGTLRRQQLASAG